VRRSLTIVCVVAACGRIGFDVDDGACPVTWSWTGDEVASWTISHLELAGVSSDMCGCAQIPTDCTCATPSACIDNTAESTANGVARFDSGPVEDGRICHRYDGFIARRAGVPVRRGLVHHVKIDVKGLAASLDGLVGVETTGYNPRWSLSVRDGSTTLATLGPISWATPQCRTCTTLASDLGTKELTFTPSSNEVELVLSARHQSSQCCSEAHDVSLEIDEITVVADTGACVVR